MFYVDYFTLYLDKTVMLEAGRFLVDYYCCLYKSSVYHNINTYLHTIKLSIIYKAVEFCNVIFQHITK